MRRALGAGLVTACLMGAVACSGDGPDAVPSPTASSASPTGTATASSSPTAVAPTLPPEAAERTAAGAEAFVRFWFEQLEYAYATGDTRQLSALSDPECRSCAELIRRVNQTYGEGRLVRGFSVDVVSSAAPPPNDFGSEVSFQLEEAGYETVEVDGSVVETVAPTEPRSAVFFAKWGSGSWLAFDIAKMDP